MELNRGRVGVVGWGGNGMSQRAIKNKMAGERISAEV